MSRHTKRLGEIAESFHLIPANEQSIGHMQMAIQEFMREVLEELRDINDYLE